MVDLYCTLNHKTKRITPYKITGYSFFDIKIIFKCISNTCQLYSKEIHIFHAKCVVLYLTYINWYYFSEVKIEYL